MNFGYQHEVDTSGETVKMIPAVGFMASGWSGGVSRPHMLANIPSEACAIVDVVNEFLKDSPTASYDSKAHRGLWRVLTIRTSRRTQECMVIIMHAPPSGGLGAKDKTDDYSQVFESEKARLVSMLTDREIVVPERDYKVSKKGENGEILMTDDDTRGMSESPTRIKVTSVFFQEFEGVSNPPPEHPVQVNSLWHLVRLATKCGLTVMPVSSFSAFVARLRKDIDSRKAGKVYIPDITGGVLSSQYRRKRDAIRPSISESQGSEPKSERHSFVGCLLWNGNNRAILYEGRCCWSSSWG
jgi:hypothetical protein